MWKKDRKYIFGTGFPPEKYTVKEFNDPDPSKYIDPNGNDERFGDYLGTNWLPDSSYIIAVKKSGSWDDMDDQMKKWAYEAGTEYPPEVAKAIKEQDARLRKSYEKACEIYK
jgi:hypothetical protein